MKISSRNPQKESILISYQGETETIFRKQLPMSFQTATKIWQPLT